MNKVMVQLFIPATGENYDMVLPQTLPVGEAARLIAEFFTGMRGGAYMPDETAVICDMGNGKICSVNSSVADLQLVNGSKLMLI